MDYKLELQKLKENEDAIGSEFWKPEAGKYRVIATSEIVDGEPYREEGKTDVPRKMISVDVDGTNHNWSMPVGKTPASTYGQLCHLASEKGNKLTALGFTVVVVGSGQNKRFTVVA